MITSLSVFLNCRVLCNIFYDMLSHVSIYIICIDRMQEFDYMKNQKEDTCPAADIFSERSYFYFLQLTIINSSWERNDVTDITHSGQVHDTTFKSKAESCMTGASVFTQI